MKNKNKNRWFVGQEVFDIRYGWGTIYDISSDEGFKVTFRSKIWRKYRISDDTSILVSTTEYSLNNHSHDPIEVLPELGAVCWVRDDNKEKWLITHFVRKQDDIYITTDANPFKYEELDLLAWSQMTPVNPFVK